MSFSDSLRGERSPGEPARQESEESASSVHPPPVKHTRRKIITGAIAAGSLLALGTGGYLDLAANWQRLTLPPLTTTDLGAINALVWSPDGKYIALAKTPETVILSDLTYTDVGTYGLQVWDADGSRLRMSHQTDDVIGSLSWSPDSKWLAAPVGNRVQILAGSGAGGKDGTPPVAQIAGVTSLPEGEDTSNRNVAAWSPDGTRLAFSHFGVSKKTGQATGVLSLWDFSRHQVLWQTTQQGNWFWTLSWSPDSQHLFSMVTRWALHCHRIYAHRRWFQGEGEHSGCSHRPTGDGLFRGGRARQRADDYDGRLVARQPISRCNWQHGQDPWVGSDHRHPCIHVSTRPWNGDAYSANECPGLVPQWKTSGLSS